MQQLMTKLRLLCFDGEVLESFYGNESNRYHVRLISNVQFNDKRNQLEFDYGIAPALRPTRLGFADGELDAVREFMAPVIAASG